MKTFFEEEFAKQQQISRTIENNLVITKQEIGKLREEINYLKKNIEFTEEKCTIFLRRKLQKFSRTFESYKKNSRKLRKM